ncbi:MAG TPA: glycerol-3-phosphate dehydrogenase/oxidase [Nevskiaceae bacterium]|nr:glycerol-3-phosphate dehydrogenase/oxidase [Nevskiaceae bacterium]
MSSAFPLRRDLDGLRSGRFDLLVIGGGIYGAWCAYDAALRGLRVALVERDDWGSGTSSASSKLIHGGLRYLEHFEFGLVRHALAERKVLTRIAPHLVRPLRFVVPVWTGDRVGRLKMRAGLALYDLLAGFGQPVDRHGAHTRRALLAEFPALRAEGLTGGLSYGDCQEDDARMTLAVVAAAQAAGVVCANGVSASELRREQGRVCGAALRSREGETLPPLHAGVVINAAGPWAPGLLGTAAPAVKRVKGVHLLMPAIAGCDKAFLLTAPQDGRVYFVIPWYGKTLLGTTESLIEDPSDLRVTEGDIRYLLEAVNHALPGLGWTPAQVLGRFVGARTLQAEEAGSLSAVSREFEVLSPLPGLLMPLGGKYTTARVDAIEVIDAAEALLGREPTPSSTDRHPLPGAPPAADFERWLAQASQQLVNLGVDAAAAPTVALRQGTRTQAVAERIREQPGQARRLHAEAPFIEAELWLAARDEMALTVDDLLRRRLPLDLLVPRSEALAAVAAAALAAV